MSNPAPPEADRLVDSAVRRTAKRLIPFLLLMYVIAFLDRSNVGFAKEELEVSIGLSAAAYAFGAGLFFVGYAVFEVPSNLIMHKVGARWWMARIMVTWGLIATAFMFVQGETMFYVLRFLLGVAEAGFFPGVLLYLTYWFPESRRAFATGLFQMGLPLANIVGGPLSGGLLEMDGLAGLAGYQWLFMVEGLFAVVVGVVAVFVLTDRPEKARWMPAEEKAALADRLAADDAARGETGGHLGWGKALLNPRVLYFCLVCLCIQAAVYGLTFFLPTQVSAITGREVGFTVGLLTSIPWACALVTIAVVPRIVDRHRRHREVGAALLVLSGAGIAVSAVAGNAVLAIVALCVAAIGFVTCQPLFWTLPTRYLSGAALAAGFGLINGLGNLGGFIAPNIRVWAEETFDSTTAGLFVLGGIAVLGALLLLGTKLMSTAPQDETRPAAAAR
ncbi:MFS transporter [Kineococcus aurantiacus]|uniref:MFS family permease n=1 Tax=Kineococcus aurantiacus TaxID=37633 RepID=A0A7Y9AU22_9ACTN|nr:MFS family permease [Kineococcus aurantiacus]